MRTIAIATAMCALGGTAGAEPTPGGDGTAPAEHAHLGVYAHAGFGLAMLDGVGPRPYDDGLRAGPAFDVALGASISRSVAVYGEVLAIDCMELFRSHHGAAGVGPGIAVSLPHRVFASASAMRLWMSESRWIPNSTGSSDRDWVAIGTGYGTSFALGTRWGSNVKKSVSLQGFVGRLSCTSACATYDEMPRNAWTTRGTMLSVSIAID